MYYAAHRLYKLRQETELYHHDTGAAPGIFSESYGNYKSVEVTVMDKREKEHYPEAMLDFGLPAEMSPIEDITGVTDAAPMVEITRPLKTGEPWEITRPESFADISEERQDRL